MWGSQVQHYVWFVFRVMWADAWCVGGGVQLQHYVWYPEPAEGESPDEELSPAGDFKQAVAKPLLRMPDKTLAKAKP
jgi:hypothetical protein